MKVAVISDLHIGQTLYRNTDDGLNKYEAILYDKLDEYVEECKKADVVIICGDVFHVPNPSIIAINKFNEMYNTLVDNCSDVSIILGNHDFNLQQAKHNTSSVSALTDFCIDFNTSSIQYDDVVFHFVPWSFSAEQKKEFEEQVLKNLDKQKYNVLIAHGTTETYMNQFNVNIAFDIPDEFIKHFDLAFIGHVHEFKEYKVGKTKTFSVGSIINPTATKCDTGIIWFDTLTKKITRQHIDTPYTEKITTDDISDIEVKNNIYKITYTGDVNKIDDEKFNELKKKALAVSLELPNEDIEESDENFESDFMTWLQDNYSDKVDLFKKISE